MIAFIESLNFKILFQNLWNGDDGMQFRPIFIFIDAILERLKFNFSLVLQSSDNYSKPYREVKLTNRFRDPMMIMYDLVGML